MFARALVAVLLAFSLYCGTALAAPTSLHSIDASEGSLIPQHRNFSRITIQDVFYGVREVGYFVTRTGHAIIDGDVVYGTEDDLLSAHAFYNTHAGNGNENTNSPRAISVVDHAWPNAKLRYRYDTTDAETKLKPIIDVAIQRWKAGASYLTFEQFPVGSSEPGIFIISNIDGGCHALPGYWGGGEVLNLHIPGCGVNEATHEMGHVLGLLHEHQRPDREANVHLLCENLALNCKMPAGATCCDANLPPYCCDTAAFAPPRDPNYDTSGPYDIDSIMHYQSHAYAKGPGLFTLVSKIPGKVVPERNPAFPSKLDFERVCKIYSKQCKKVQ